jgi:integrase
MGRKKVRIYQHPSRKVYIGRYHETGKEVTLISIEELKQICGRSEQRKNQLLEKLYQDNDQVLPSDERDAFLQMILNTRSPNTYRDYKNALQKLPELSEKGIQHLIRNEKAAGRSEASINSYLRAVRVYSNWSAARSKTQPVEVKMLREVSKPVAAFSEQQLDQLEDYLEGKKEEGKRWRLLRLAHHVLRHTGLRGSELLHLTWEDVSINTREIRVGDSELQRVKGRKEQLIVFPQILQPVLENEIKDHHYLLHKYWAHLNELTAAMRKVQRSLGISGPKPLHGYRASYCKKLFNSGFSAPLVKRSLRHASITTTISYYDDQVTDLRNAFDCKYLGNIPASDSPD